VTRRVFTKGYISVNIEAIPDLIADLKGEGPSEKGVA
jgi:hypothetical protein